MAAPESSSPGANPTLFDSLRSFWSVLLSILQTRLDLATFELEEEASRAVQLLAVIFAAVLCIGMTIFFLLCFLVILSGSYLPLVVGIICVACVIGSLILVFTARRMIQNRPKFLSQTLAELRRDVDSLRPVEPKPETPTPTPTP